MSVWHARLQAVRACPSGLHPCDRAQSCSRSCSCAGIRPEGPAAVQPAHLLKLCCLIRGLVVHGVGLLQVQVGGQGDGHALWHGWQRGPGLWQADMTATQRACCGEQACSLEMCELTHAAA